MHSALRRMGNSTGLIVPRSILTAAGVASGTTLDLVVEDGRIVATPVHAPRAGWAEAAVAIAAAREGDDEAAWRDVGVEGDADLTW